MCKEREAWKSRHMGEKTRWKISCEKIDSFIFFMCSVVLKCFPVKETFALTHKYILQKRQRQKTTKKSLTWVRQLSRNRHTKIPSQKWKWEKDGWHFWKDSSSVLSIFPHVFMFRSTVKFAGGKKAFHEVLKNSGLRPLGLLIIISAKMAKDYILQKLNTHPFVNFFDTGKKSKDSWSRYLQHLHFPKCKIIFPE